MNLPESFRTQIQALLGNEADTFFQALHSEIPVSLRLNNGVKFLEESFYSTFEKVLWCDRGYYLPSRPVFTLDPLFHAGMYYVQEAASMYLEQCVKQIVGENNEPQIALDLCAAPGGKSTHLANLLPQNSLLVSNEIIRSRANILHENIVKWGNPNCVVTNNDPKDFSALNHFFDIILVDAPCSGEGMFRKDTGAINEWSEANVKLCAERQQRILADVWGALKPNGYLIYSTCTYNLLENEQNVEWLLREFDAEPVNIPFSDEWGVTPSFVDGIYAARFFPHKTQSEGLFMAVLKKRCDNSSFRKIKSVRSSFQKLNKNFDFVKEWINNYDNKTFIQHANTIYALPTEYINEIELLTKHLKVLQTGIAIGEIKGKDVIPSAALALNKQIDRRQFVVWEVDTDTALNYLRRNSITAQADMPKGYILLTYKQTPLGWIKNIGNRTNNLYPQEWRIRHL